MANDISPSDLSDSERSDGLKKTEISQLEHTQTHDDHVSFDTKATKRLLRKMDIRLIPFLALLYLLSFLDRYVSICQEFQQSRFLRLSWVTQMLNVA